MFVRCETKSECDHFIPSTVRDGLSSSSRAAQAETFCVVTTTPFETEEEVISLKNATDFGCVDAVWTSDVFTAFSIAVHGEDLSQFANN